MISVECERGCHEVEEREVEGEESYGGDESEDPSARRGCPIEYSGASLIVPRCPGHSYST